MFTVYHKKRNEIFSRLKKRGIKLNIYYPYPIHMMKGYKFLSRNKKLKLKKTEKLSQGIFSLPLYPELSFKDLEKFTKSLKSVMKSI